MTGTVVNTNTTNTTGYLNCGDRFKKAAANLPPLSPSPLPPPATKPCLGQFTALLHLQFELFTAILSGVETFLITALIQVVMVSPNRHVRYQ